MCYFYVKPLFWEHFFESWECSFGKGCSRALICGLWDSWCHRMHCCRKLRQKNYFYLFHSGIINFLNRKLHKLEFDKTKEAYLFRFTFPAFQSYLNFRPKHYSPQFLHRTDLRLRILAYALKARSEWNQLRLLFVRPLLKYRKHAYRTAHCDCAKKMAFWGCQKSPKPRRLAVPWSQKV